MQESTSARILSTAMLTPSMRNFWKITLALGLGVLLSGCGFSGVISKPRREPMFDRTVDSIVVSPIAVTGGANLMPRDLEVFQEQLETELATRPQLRVFKQPPTDLPNTVILILKFLSFQQRDLSDQDMLVREIHLDFTMDYRQGNNESVKRALQRKISLQRAHPLKQPLPKLPVDLKRLAREMAEQIVEALYPEQQAAPIYLDTAFDSITGKILAVRKLIQANSLAENNSLDLAARMWRLVLFEPMGLAGANQFMLSPRSLGLLEKQKVPKEILEKLAPLITAEELDLVDFRARVRQSLGGISPYDGKILVAAKADEERLQRNVAAAHNNLGSLYWFDKRYDLAAFHTARAYAHYPTEGNLNRWLAIQGSRELLPPGVEGKDAIMMFLRLPPPRDLLWKPAARDAEILPPGVIPPMQPPGPSNTETPRQPVGSPGTSLPENTSPGASSMALPPIQSLERSGTDR